jgi:multiple sugar transport system ATP-binding protein
MLDGQVSAAGTVTLTGGATVAVDRDLPIGRSVILGIRPEDLHPGGETPVIEGTVDVREPLGHETLIYVSTPAGSEIVAKADGRTPPAVGERVRLSALAANMHVFDATTGEALA